MRILIATPLYPPDDGGPATYAKLIEAELPKYGIETKILSFSHFRSYPKIIRHLLYMYQVFIQSKDVDLIYALDPVSVGFPAAIVAKLRSKKFVIKIVGDYAWEQGVQRFGVKENLDQFVEKSDYSLPVRILRTVQKWSAEKADLVIVPSQYLKRLIFYWGIPNGKISVIYNAFQAYVSTQTKQDLREELGIFAPTIISVGRFVPWKGFKVLMDAVGQVQKTIPDVVLEIAGSGDSAEYVQYAHEHGYDFVHFLGVLSHDELMRRIRAADCFALNTGYEGLSHVILEAMALETPIVTTNVGGNPELFASWSQVPLAEYNDEAELSSRMLLMLSDKQSSGNAAKSAKVFVESFTEQRMAQETASMLQSLFPTI